MTPERIALLEELDFAWNAQEAAWIRHMTDLKKFVAEEGHCKVPPNHPDYPKLREWVTRQQWHYNLFKQGKPSVMTQDRADALEKIGAVREGGGSDDDDEMHSDGDASATSSSPSSSKDNSESAISGDDEDDDNNE